MKNLLILASVLILVAAASTLVSGTPSQDQGLDIARALNTSELDIFMKSHRYGQLTAAVQNAQRMQRQSQDLTAILAGITPVDSTSAKAGNYVLSLVTPEDGSHFKLSITPAAKDCTPSLFTDELGVIYEGKPIDCPNPSEHD